MAEGLKIEIVSPERLVLSEVVTSVTVPGTEGYFTVMDDHAPFMTTLRPGFITVNRNGVRSKGIRGPVKRAAATAEPLMFASHDTREAGPTPRAWT